MGCSSDDIKAYAKSFLLFCLMLTFLYFFLVALDVMGASLQVLAGDSAASLFSFVDNPVAGLCIGILVTCLVQSSSTTTSIIVAMVGAGVLGVEQATYMVFGANIGTSVTSTLVCFTFIKNRENYSRGFAAATVHDMFNWMNVALWFPLEWITDAINGGNGGVLFLLTDAMVSGFSACEETDDSSCDSWESPIKTITNAISKKMISVNKDVLKDYAVGSPSVELCSSLFCSSNDECSPYVFHDKQCTDSAFAYDGQCNEFGNNTKDHAEFLYCTSRSTVNESVLNAAIVFYDELEPCKGGFLYPLQWESGLANFVISIIMLFAALALMVKTLNALIRGRAEKWVKSALNMNGYLAIVIGTGVTMFVQSSSITTSVLTPMAAIGSITLESMLPLTLGANIGTTITGILAAMVGDSIDGMQIALVHLMFNVFGVVLFYPIPYLRQLPIRASKKLGRMAYISKPFPALYIAFVFFIGPAVLLCLSLLFTIAGTGGIIAGSILTVLFALGLVYFAFWFKKRGGSEKISKWIDKRYQAAENGDKDVDGKGDENGDENGNENVQTEISDSASDSSDDVEAGDHHHGHDHAARVHVSTV